MHATATVAHILIWIVGILAFGIDSCRTLVAGDMEMDKRSRIAIFDLSVAGLSSGEVHSWVAYLLVCVEQVV